MGKECKGFDSGRGRLIARDEGEDPRSIQKKIAQRVVAVTIVIKSLLRDTYRIDTIAMTALVI